MKLTNTMRDTMLNRLMSHRFDSADAEMREREVRLADLAYHTVHTAEDVALLRSLPEGFVPTLSMFHLYVSYSTQAQVSLGDSRRVKYRHQNGYVQLDSDTLFVGLREAVEEYAGEVKALADSKSAVKTQLKAALNSFNTLEKLLANWPEVKPFTHGLAPVKNLPAINIVNLNAVCGLPVEGA